MPVVLSATAGVLRGVLPLTFEVRSLFCAISYLDQMPLLISAALMRLRATLITLADSFLTLM